MADGLSLLPLGVSSWFATRPGEKAEKGGAVAIREDVGAFLVSHADEGYRAFQAKLIPNIDAATIVGVRTPTMVAASMFGMSFAWNARYPSSAWETRNAPTSSRIATAPPFSAFSPGLVANQLDTPNGRRERPSAIIACSATYSLC